MNDLLQMNLSTLLWTNLTGGLRPRWQALPARALAGVATDGARLYIFGGFGVQGASASILGSAFCANQS